jgi:hypothetical protein
VKEKEESSLSVQDKKKYLKIGDKQYLVGNEKICDKILVDQDFHGSKKWKVLTAWALYKYAQSLGVKELEIDDLAMGLPYAQFTKQHISKITFNSMSFDINNEQYSFTVKNFHTFPQGLSVLGSPNLNLDPEMQQEDLHLGIIDIGYYTIDLIDMKYGELNNEKSTALNQGVHLAYKRIEKLAQDITGSMSSIPFAELNRLIKNGSITFNKKEGKITHNLSSKITEKLQKYTDDIIDVTYDFWGNEVDSMVAIIFAGGGASLVKDYIPNNGTNIIIDDARFANARGYMSCMTS